MSLWNTILRLVKDPPPGCVFELSELGLAYSVDGNSGFQPFEAGTLQASSTSDNLLRPDAIAQTLNRVAPVAASAGKRRRPAALLLPDSAVRVSILDFDSFPSTPEEQVALVRFRVKKTIPFDMESAAVSYCIQGKNTKTGKTEVVAVTVALEVLARYEALLRNAGFQPGEVLPSSMGALNLCPSDGVVVLAKLAGKILTVMAVAAGKLKLFRCLPLEDATEAEILSVLFPTFAYVEDELGVSAKKLILCGFPNGISPLPFETEPLRSRLGSPAAFNSGLLGYLEGMGQSLG